MVVHLPIDANQPASPFMTPPLRRYSPPTFSRYSAVPSAIGALSRFDRPEHTSTPTSTQQAASSVELEDAVSSAEIAVSQKIPSVSMAMEPLLENSSAETCTHHFHTQDSIGRQISVALPSNESSSDMVCEEHSDAQCACESDIKSLNGLQTREIERTSNGSSQTSAVLSECVVYNELNETDESFDNLFKTAQVEDFSFILKNRLLF